MSEGDKNTPVDFGREAASKAAQAVAEAKKRRVPIGVIPPPKMPRLDHPPPASPQGIQSVKSAQRVLTPEEQARLQEAGKFHPGVGSAYAANQPAARALPPTNDEGENLPIDPKLAPRPAGAGLRPETIRELEGVAAANAKPSKDDEELAKINKEIDEIDDVFETNEFGERVKSLLGNKERARIIESRCLPISLEELLISGSVNQKVPIVPGKFEPTFRSLSGQENLEILRLMNSVRGPDEYILDMLQIFRLTAGLYALNTKVMPSHLNNDGDFDEELFRKKHKIVIRMALPILADMSVNFGWFVRRVQKLTVIDDIKSF